MVVIDHDGATNPQPRLPAERADRDPSEAARPGVAAEPVAVARRREGAPVAYQPVVDLASGRVVGVVASTGLAGTPEVHGPEAQEDGRRVEDEVLAVRSALDGIALLPDGAFLSVPASAVTIASSALADCLADVPGWRIVVELAGHGSIADHDALAPGIEALRDRGVRLAIIDTGTGTSSLRRILRFAPDVIVLDRALVAGIDTDLAGRALVAASVLLARETGADLVGDGIETEAELRTLRSLGVALGRGPVLAEPGPLPGGSRYPVPKPAPGAPQGPSPQQDRPLLAAALHDGPMQTISAASLRLQLLRMDVGAGPHHDELDRAIAELRAVAEQLGEIVARLGSAEPD